jgi:acyl-ACP thioesterase
MFKSEKNPISCSDFNCSIKQIIKNSNNDSLYLSKAFHIFESTKALILNRQRKEEEEMSNQNKKYLKVAEYRITKAIHGRKHPFCSQVVYNDINDHINTNKYFGYTERNRAYKYFQDLNIPREGYKYFLEIFKKNHSYSNMGKII